jgi:hypothetical protein
MTEVNVNFRINAVCILLAFRLKLPHLDSFPLTATPGNRPGNFGDYEQCLNILRSAGISANYRTAPPLNCKNLIL